MELKSFITEVLVDIKAGIHDANTKLTPEEKINSEGYGILSLLAMPAEKIVLI